MIKKIAMGVVALVVLGLAVAALWPRTWHVDRSIRIEATAEQIHPWLADLKRWQEWSVWTRAMDPSVHHIYEGQQDGAGARWTWMGTRLGRGQVEITSADPRTGVELDESIESSTVNARASIRYAERDGATVVSWVDEGALPPMMGLFRGSVEARLGAQMEQGLAQLKQAVEARAPIN